MYARFGKRLLDIVAATFSLIILAPVMALLALGVRLSSPGPVIFRQSRIGRGGESFEFYKFRSMPADTASVSSDQLGTVQISAFGRFLRRSNLDELPQLVNVLKGDMSLIGPRPPIASQTELIELRRANGALDCRPGLTGLAQVRSYDGMSVEKKAAYDGEYAATIGFLRDLSVVVRTFGYLAKPPPTY